ncbi:MAG TPA: polysaccharide biosynthesis/export family protein [Candidatus Eisenbacteria bacterium]|nr:polysaccharide biosynthesis/export family protein [Candidatus Eisenbacteria bacterium]
MHAITHAFGSARAAFRASGRLALVMLTGLMFHATGFTAESTAYLVSPGDVLQVTLFAGVEKETEFTTTVSPTGTITCPLIGDYPVAGQATPQIARGMTAALARGYIVNPQVIVAIKEYGGTVSVMGSVKKPGVYPIKQGLTALVACDMAGGFTDFASPKKAHITRTTGGKPRRIEVDIAKIRQGRIQDVVLQSGDRLEIPQRWF